jgi:hypothetical protein
MLQSTVKLIVHICIGQWIPLMQIIKHMLVINDESTCRLEILKWDQSTKSYVVLPITLFHTDCSFYVSLCLQLSFSVPRWWGAGKFTASCWSGLACLSTPDRKGRFWVIKFCSCCKHSCSLSQLRAKPHVLLLFIFNMFFGPCWLISSCDRNKISFWCELGK